MKIKKKIKKLMGKIIYNIKYRLQDLLNKIINNPEKIEEIKKEVIDLNVNNIKKEDDGKKPSTPKKKTDEDVLPQKIISDNFDPSSIIVRIYININLKIKG